MSRPVEGLYCERVARGALRAPELLAREDAMDDPHFACACCGGLMRQAWSRRKFLAAAGAAGLMAPRFACAEDVASIAYESVPDLLHLPPDLYLGEVSGVALNSAGHIFVLHRGNSTGPAYGAAAAQLLEFDRNGELPARDRPQSLRLVLRPHRQGRRAGQYLGDRQGLGHGDQVHAGRPGRHGVRAQAGSFRRRTPGRSSTRTRRFPRATDIFAR